MWGKYKYPPHKLKILSELKMPYKRSYKKKPSRRPFGKRRKRKTRGPMMKRRKYKKPDSGTFLKISSPALPVIINNLSTPTGSNQLVDTYNCRLTFAVGGQGTISTSVLLNNEANTELEPQNFADLDLGVGSDHAAYASLYRYYQVYKIVVKFYPTITEGGTLTSGTDQSTNQFINAISGTVTTDVSRVTDTGYWDEYPADNDGQTKAQSRKVARTHNILKPWTRTFVPSNPIQRTGNPRAEYQYKPKYETSTNANQDLGLQQFIIRMKKPTIAGFAAATEADTEVAFPAADTFVRFGTLTATAFIKYIQPFN